MTIGAGSVSADKEGSISIETRRIETVKRDANEGIEESNDEDILVPGQPDGVMKEVSNTKLILL